MYAPETTPEDHRGMCIDAMRGLRFATLVTPGSAGISITHVPTFIRVDADTITVQAHLARANPHSRAEGESVAIFQGPQAYVTPSWYPSKAEHGKVVPTWAYIAVHAHGTLRRRDEPEWLERHLNDLTDANEADREAPWKVGDAPASYVGALSRGIVGVELTVMRLDGRWKLNQMKPEADREGTRAGLAASGEDGLALSRALDALGR